MVLESGLLQEREERMSSPIRCPRRFRPAWMTPDGAGWTPRDGEGAGPTGATLGREFAYALLQAVSPWEEATLQQGLQQLVEAEFLYQQGLPPQATYRFKHALIQDTAYQSLLRSTRQQYHQRIAQVLEARFPETCETQPELLAQHYTEAGFIAQALPYWQHAGAPAIQRSAHLEAIAHVQRGLALLTTLPDTPQRCQHEFAFLTTLGPALMATKGYAASEVVQAYTRARALCQQIGETPEQVPVLWNLWFFYMARGDHQTALEHGEQCLQLAQRVQDGALLLEAHYALGCSWFLLGNPVLAGTHMAQTIALYDPAQHYGLAYRYGGIDPGVGGFGVYALALWMRGYPVQARAHLDQALRLAQVHLAPSLFARTHAALRHDPVSITPGNPSEPYQATEEIAVATPRTLPWRRPLGSSWRAGPSACRSTVRGPRPDTAGSRHVPVNRGGISTAALSDPAGRGVWPPRPARGGVGGLGRSTDRDGTNGGAVLRSGAPSAAGRTAAPA